MAEALFDTLFPEVRTQITSAPIPTVRREIRNAAIEFCKKSEAYRVNISQTIDAGQHTFAIDIPTGTTLVAPKELRFEGHRLTNGSDKLAGDNYGNWRESTGTPTMVYKSGITSVTLVLPPRASGVLSGSVAIKPSRSAQTIDDTILEEHAEAISAGALSRLLGMPLADWYNPQEAINYAMQFEEMIVDAKAEANNDHVYKDIIVQYGGL